MRLQGLVGGGPTYQRIVDNLGLLKPPITTLIRANVHALPELWTFQSVVGFVLAAFWESRTGLPTSSSIRLVWRLPLQT